ncbi:hypothetical protein L596_029644 [Steinernema carpocapsae]|uniref:Uncharacterized protein n=1 Tax=Steinernema carpocapsae TaxID=34508 RepID=A0A4U5LV81_STECR|nr:hypothetical protein L596_029644 [Steinernema carpocapsae]
MLKLRTTTSPASRRSIASQSIFATFVLSSFASPARQQPRTRDRRTVAGVPLIKEVTFCGDSGFNLQGRAMDAEEDD